MPAILKCCNAVWDAGATPCDIQIEGVDSVAPGLKGGLDGVYKVATCENGRPLYKRETADSSGKCCLSFSNFFTWSHTRLGYVQD